MVLFFFGFTQEEDNIWTIKPLAQLRGDNHLFIRT